MEDRRDSITSDERPAKKARIARACLQCRSRKQRCLATAPDVSLNAPCQRCSGNGTTCSFETDLHPSSEPGLRPSQLSQLVVDLHQRIDMHEARIEQLEAELSMARQTPATRTQNAASPRTRPAPPVASAASARRPPPRHSQASDFNMDTLQLEAPIATLRSLGAISPDSTTTQPHEGHRQKPASTTVSYDPVRLGIVSKQEARRAVNIFFTHCHPWAPFLDDELAHKDDELGETSPLLFLAVVSIGAQFWSEPASLHGSGPPAPPHLHPRYFELAALLDTAVSRLLLAPVPSDATIDAVCALLLYSQWMPYLREDGKGGDGAVKSRYNDLSAWVVFGLAVRYASFLGLERRTTRPFKNNAVANAGAAWATRADLAWARVWINLVTYDCNLTLTSGLPASIDPTRVEVMARQFGQHRLAQFPGDLRYSALVELACIMQRARDGERKGAGAYARGHPNVDVLKRANMGLEDWERQWLPKLRHTHMQHIQLPFTSLRWYQLALNSSALRRILSLSGEPSEECDRQRDPQPVPVWALSALEIGLTAAAQILFSLTTGAASSVWHLQSQDPSTIPGGPFSVDAAARHSVYHAVDSLWISHAFSLIFLELCYVRGHDLQICSLAAAPSHAHRAPTKPRPASVLARLAQLSLDIFQPPSHRGGSDVSAFRPIHKISTLVANATSLVLSTSTAPSNHPYGGHASPTPTAPVGGLDDPHADLQGLFDLMDDSELGWPATLSVFEDPFHNVTTGEWRM